MPFAKPKCKWTMLRRRGRRRRRWTKAIYNTYQIRKMMDEVHEGKKYRINPIVG